MSLTLPAFRWLEDLPRHGALVEFVGGTHDGVVAVLKGLSLAVAGRLAAEYERRSKFEAAARADELLVSLLDADQLATWRRDGVFWVPTPRGPVRLGVLYDLKHLPNDRRGRPTSLCVLPTGDWLPAADIWSNLLLMLLHRPDDFFSVANVVGVPRQARA